MHQSLLGTTFTFAFSIQTAFLGSNTLVTAQIVQIGQSNAYCEPELSELCFSKQTLSKINREQPLETRIQGIAKWEETKNVLNKAVNTFSLGRVTEKGSQVA